MLTFRSSNKSVTWRQANIQNPNANPQHYRNGPSLILHRHLASSPLSDPRMINTKVTPGSSGCIENSFGSIFPCSV